MVYDFDIHVYDFGCFFRMSPKSNVHFWSSKGNHPEEYLNNNDIIDSEWRCLRQNMLTIHAISRLGDKCSDQLGGNSPKNLFLSNRIFCPQKKTSEGTSMSLHTIDLHDVWRSVVGYPKGRVEDTTMAEKSAPPVSVTCAAVTETGESLGIQKVNHFRCNQVQHKMSKGMIALQKAVLV